MKHHLTFWASTSVVFRLVLGLLLGLGLAAFAGCGSGSGGGSTSSPPPSISSFTPSPGTVTDNTTAQLTAVFTNGTGVITPGNLSVTSGTAVTVTPPSNATTTYTLTVTGASGTTPATQTTSIQAVAAPAISGYSVSPGVINSGQSSSLTATFSGGTGVITPGNVSVTSGTPVSVSPTSSTTYTLTVTNAAGTAVTEVATVTVSTQTNPTTVTIDPSSPGIAVTDQILGMNLAAWYDIETNDTAIVSAFQAAGIKAVRWPGGSWSDLYHWDGHDVGQDFNGPPFNCQNPPYGGGTPDSNDTFVNFVNDIVLPAGLDLALTADYGTNVNCNGPGEPSEAAYWITAAASYGVKVSHMTVGNEVYGSLAWEENLSNPTPTSVNQAATQYATAMTGSTGFYASIQAAGAVQSPPPLIGVVVDADNLQASNDDAWDNVVLPNAAGSYDFVELHYYPQAPGSESDTYLTQQAAQGLTTEINTVKDELLAAGEAGKPIYVGEMGSVYTNPGKQSMSITQGLYAGQMLGEMMNDGVSRATWWIGFGNCNGTNGNDSSSLYGWQDFGAYNVFSDGSEDPCMPWGTIGTMSPTARAFQLFSNVAVNGEHVLTPTVTGDTNDVRAYSATHSGGTALVLFDVNETESELVSITVNGETTSPGVTVITYSKSIYDQTQSDTWTAPTTTNMGSQTLPLSLTLAPWSMNVVLIQ